jgi:hypothetical protein
MQFARSKKEEAKTQTQHRGDPMLAQHKIQAYSSSVWDPVLSSEDEMYYPSREEAEYTACLVYHKLRAASIWTCRSGELGLEVRDFLEERAVGILPQGRIIQPTMQGPLGEGNTNVGQEHHTHRQPTS